MFPGYTVFASTKTTMVSYSVKLKGNLPRIRKDGFAPLYLIVIINREVKYIPLKLTWPADLIVNKNGIIKPRQKNEKEPKNYPSLSKKF